MTSFNRGDVVLVKFVFADEKGAKQRPGLIVSTGRYHRGRRETILAAITSNVAGSWWETTRSRLGANPVFCPHQSSRASSEQSSTT